LIQGRKLFLAAKDANNTNTPIKRTQKIYDFTTEPKELIIYSGLFHFGEDILVAHKEKIEELIFALLADM
ncbi:MAG: hypothetical protein N2D54_00690, partial [Chloroflexota bacterium]